MNICVIYLTVVMSGAAFGQVFRNNGVCPQPPVKQNFDVQRFSSGRWFEIERYFAIFEMGVRCVSATFHAKSERNIQMSFNAKNITTGFAIVINGTGTINNPEEAAKIAVTFIPGINLNMLNFWILDTDYDDYAVIWSCANFIHTRMEFGWIMSRKPTLDKKIVERIHENLENIGVQSKDFIKSNQENCEYQEMTSNVTEKNQII